MWFTRDIVLQAGFCHLVGKINVITVRYTIQTPNIPNTKNRLFEDIVSVTRYENELKLTAYSQIKVFIFSPLNPNLCFSVCLQQINTP